MMYLRIILIFCNIALAVVLILVGSSVLYLTASENYSFIWDMMKYEGYESDKVRAGVLTTGIIFTSAGIMLSLSLVVFRKHRRWARALYFLFAGVLLFDILSEAAFKISARAYELPNLLEAFAVVLFIVITQYALMRRKDS